jgi:hypothetical protein
MARIPQFKNLQEAADFWDTHDFEDYVDHTEPVRLTVKIQRRKRERDDPTRSEHLSAHREGSSEASNDRRTSPGKVVAREGPVRVATILGSFDSAAKGK